MKDKVCVITASASGIGFATAQRMGREGAIVVISSRNQDHVNEAVGLLRKESIRAEGVVCDVSKNRKSLLDFVETRFGKIDVLVNNAAVIDPNLTGYTEEEAFDHIFNVNVKSAFFLVKEALPLLKKSVGASVIFVGSELGYLTFPPQKFYSVSKTTLLGMVKVLGMELIKYNIRVNGVAPGLIKTPLSQPFWDMKIVLDRVASKRMGAPEEVASLICYLCREEAAYIVAENIIVNGGTTTRL